MCTTWYGAGRFVEDFFRIDDTHGTGLTGSQWTSLLAVLAAGFVLLVRRRTPAIGRGHGSDADDTAQEVSGAATR